MARVHGTARTGGHGLTATVDTVRGPVPVDRLGRTLMHEHMTSITAEIARDFPDRSWVPDRPTVLAGVVREVRAARASGVDTIVDATAIGHGRDIRFVQEVNEQVDINILCATGIYTFDQLSFFFQFRPHRSGEQDVMTDLFIDDITRGIQGTGVRAAIIKCATGKQGVTPNVERVLRAAAAAHLATGAPITTHTEASERNGLDQQRIFAAEGVDLTSVVIGHSGDTLEIDYLRELMDNGSTTGHDRFGLYLPGWPTFEQRVATVARLCGMGYSDRMVLSHDRVCHTDWRPPSERTTHPSWVLTHMLDAVVPALRAAGVDEADLTAMLVDNPRRMLGRRGVGDPPPTSDASVRRCPAKTKR